jgi:exodeoxyribonuclease X
MTAIIRVIDVETCGLDPATAGVCEIGACEVERTLTGWQVGGGLQARVNPGHPIPPEASAIHQIVDDDVADAEPWEQAISRLLWVSAGRETVAFAAHNAKFERQWITNEITGGKPWICTYKAALRLWPAAPLHSNQCLRHWRKPAGLDRAIADQAHRALPDAYVTAHLLRDMLNDGATVEQLIEWSGQPALQVRCQIGKFRGTPWREVDEGFMRWVLDRDFDEDVKFTCQTEIKRREQEDQAQ